MLRWKEASRAERALLLLLVFLAAPLAAKAQNSRFGMNGVNSAPGLTVGGGTIQDADAAAYRYEISTRNLGARSTRWVLWWHDIERYNNYQGAPDAVGEPSCDDSTVNALPSGDPRIFWTWSSINQHPPGNPEPRRRFDQLLDADVSHGLETLLVLQGVPRCRQEIPNVKVMPRNLSEPVFLDRNGRPDHRIGWYGARELDNFQPRAGRINPANPFAYFVFKAVERYGDRVHWWQVWNEVDTPTYWPGTAEEYARLVEVAFHAARYANTEAKLVMSGLQDRPLDPTNDRPDAERIVNALKARSTIYRNYRYIDYFDAYAIHSYLGPWAAINFLHWLHTTMGLNDIPIWLTETGVNADPTVVDEESRASYVLQLVSYLLAKGGDYGLDRFFHFALDNAVHHTGLLDCTGTGCSNANRREMYFAYETVNQYLRDARPVNVSGSPLHCEIDPLLRWDRETIRGQPCTHQRVYFTSPRFDRITVLWSTDGNGTMAQVPATGTKALLAWQDTGRTPANPVFAVNGRYQISLPAIEHLEDPMGGRTAILLECRAGNTNCDVRRSKVDLTFVVDTTGSMWDDIESVRSAASQITSAIFGETADARVAVTDFRDFPVSPYGSAGDYPFNVVTDFASDASTVSSGLQQLAIGNGANWPESVYSGLMGAIEGLADSDGQRLSGWRPDASKFILLMGDAPPNDPEPCTPQSCRRLTLSQVVSAARAGGIQALSAVAPTYSLSPATAAVQESNPIKIYSILIGNDSGARFYYQKLAEDTGGKLFTAANSSQIVAAILEALGGIHTPPSNQPPDVSGATASVSLLWPPNHKMREVRIFNVIDPDGDPFTLTVTRITQDEPVSGREPDGEGIGTDTARLRAERSGTGNSRVYRIELVARDSRGGESTGSVLVCVPHDQGPNTACQDDGQLYDSTRP